MRRRFMVTAFVGALGVVASFAALAWACTPQAYIEVPSASGPAGTSVTVTGRGFVAAPVEITWSGGGVLGAATGPDFAVTVQIPAAAPGVYYISATARDTASGVIGHATRAFEVLAPPAPTAVEAPAAQAPAAAAELETSGATRPSSATRGERGRRPNARPAQAAEAAAPVTATSRASAVADPVARTRDGQRAVTGSRTAGRERSAPATRAPRAVRRDRPDAAASPATGVAAHPASWRAAAQARPAGDGPGWPIAAALALLAYGVLTLMAIAAPRVARALAARRRIATEPPLDEIVLPDDLLERLGAVLDEAADEAAGRTESERPLNV